MDHNPKAPHQAVILVRYEIHERDETGRCIGRPADTKSELFTFIGKDFQEAQSQAEEFIGRLNNGEKTTKETTGKSTSCSGKGCGKCKIRDLLALSRRYNVPVSVATGGTLARRIVVEKKPEVIIAVACERDLTSGIQDSYPIPVFGILNKRPFGPCFDTDVDLPLVENALVTFLDCEPGERAFLDSPNFDAVASQHG